MSFDQTLEESFVLAHPVAIENDVEKVPNKPVKRPHNAYNLFFIERKPIEREKHQKLSGNEISQLIGKMWNEMSQEEKRPYVEKANIIRQQFKEENPNYHYQKSSEKQKKKRIQNQNILPRDSMIFGNATEQTNSNANLNTQIPFEFQLRNMFSSLGQQVVMRYLTQNNAEVDGIIKNSQITISETIDSAITDINAPVLNQ